MEKSCNLLLISDNLALMNLSHAIFEMKPKLKTLLR